MSQHDLRRAPFVLLDDSRAPHLAGDSLLFHSPDRIIQADNFEALPAALAAMDEAYAEGLHLAGWISYEVAAAFEAKLAPLLNQKRQEPLIWMMATPHRDSLSSDELDELFNVSNLGNRRPAKISVREPIGDRNSYLDAINKIQSYIQAGDVYQINHTFPLPVEIAGDPLTLYQRLRSNQPVPYGAYINTGKHQILSLSPELFLDKSGDTLSARPMKGTAARGTTSEEDDRVSTFLKQDEKSRAENLMIVDLIRNDLSRVAAPSSVKVSKLFDTERYPTLFQMTSTVTAKATADLRPSGLLAAMFPCGSVTGAPKVRAMQIIHELEAEPRGVYCGTIGHFSPATQGAVDNWTLNVPIRTLSINQEGKGRLNIGSGIVADSDPASEYDECLLKAQFVHSEMPHFCLIETLRWENGRYHFLERHLKRLTASAHYFEYACDEAEIRRALSEHSREIVEQEQACRVRLLMDRRGHCAITSSPLEALPYFELKDVTDLLSRPPAGTVSTSRSRVTASDKFLRHKTTVRTLYDEAHKEAVSLGHLDTLFFNEKEQLTEGAISNVFVYRDGNLFTPPVKDGALPGILREDALAAGTDLPVQEKSLARSDIETAEAIFIGNAVRGFRRVEVALPLQP